MTIAVWSSAMLWDSKSEWIVRIDHQPHVAVDEGPAGNRGNDAAFRFPISALKDAADDRFLPPDLAWLELAIGRQAGEFRAGARATGGAVVLAAGAQHEIPRIGHGR